MLSQNDHGSSVEIDKWLIAKGEESGFPMLFRIRQGVPPSIRTKRYPFLINIYWRFEDKSNSGLPPKEVLERMGELEERLDMIEDSENGFMVISITGNQRKEWIWYTCNERLFVMKLNKALEGLEPFPIEVSAAKDPKWNNYTSLLAKVKQ